MSNQWTTKFGEHITEELILLRGDEFYKPERIDGMEPDLGDSHTLWETKAGTYFTDGTAHEKIMGVFMKYRNVPKLYGKPLKVICMGRAEQTARDQFGLLPGPKMDETAMTILDAARDLDIEYVGATDLLMKL